MSGRHDQVDTRAWLWLVALLYAALTLVLTYPLPLQMASAVLNDNPDTHLFLWTLGWDVHALTTQPFSIFDANIYYPQRLTLAYSENLIGSAFLAAPVLWLTGNSVLALNVVTLLSCTLCGLGTYVLARRLGLGIASAILCGLVFAFSPGRFFRITQVHLATVQWIPFTLAYLHAYLDGGRARDVRLAIAFFSLQALTSGHGAVFATLAVAGLVVFRFASGDRHDIAARCRDIGIPGLVLLSPAVLVLLPYLAVERELGLQRSLENFDPVPVSFLASPTSVHSFILSLLPGRPVNEAANGFLFPGYVPLFFAGLAIVSTRPERWNRTLFYYALLTMLCVWLSVGTPLKLWSWVSGFPGLSLVRVPSRFMILAVLGLSVLAGLGLERVTRGLSTGRGRAFAVFASALLLLECSGIPLQLAPFRVDPPAVDRWLDTQPKPFVIAEIPVGLKSRFQTTYMLHSMAHWQKTVQGYSGVQAPVHDRLFEELKFFPDERSLQHLASLGVNYVVVHADGFDSRQWADVDRVLPQFHAWLTLVHQEGDGRVYALHRPVR
ncbi:MAG: hypothetical protein ACRD2N_13120 [Vicinamibacterales bacterium]